MNLKQISNFIQILLLAAILLGMGSCKKSNVFEQYRKLEKQSWNRFNILKFEIPINDTQTPVDILLAIRHLPEFQIRELPVNITLYMPSGEMRSAEELLKFTEKDGKSLSECLGDLCDISFILRENFTFSEPGTVRIEIENKWPKVELPGILEVGLVINRFNN
jgi:gliding motility-associated lipoprotein GldH